MAQQPSTRSLIEMLIERVEQNNRTLRGSNGDEGLVARVSLLASKMDSLEETVLRSRDEFKENCNELKASMKELTTSRDDYWDDELEELREALVNEKLDQKVSWKEIIKDWAGPLLMAILTALMLSHMIP